MYHFDLYFFYNIKHKLTNYQIYFIFQLFNILILVVYFIKI